MYRISLNGGKTFLNAEEAVAELGGNALAWTVFAWHIVFLTKAPMLINMTLNAKGWKILMDSRGPVEFLEDMLRCLGQDMVTDTDVETQLAKDGLFCGRPNFQPELEISVYCQMSVTQKRDIVLSEVLFPKFMLDELFQLSPDEE